MLHNKFKIIGRLVLEKKILKVFTIYGHGRHFRHMTWTIYINFRTPFPRRLRIQFGFDLQLVSKEKMSEHCLRQRRRQQRRRTPKQGYTISSPCEPDGSGEVKTKDTELSVRTLLRICIITKQSSR